MVFEKEERLGVQEKPSSCECEPSDWIYENLEEIVTKGTPLDYCPVPSSQVPVHRNGLTRGGLETELKQCENESVRVCMCVREIERERKRERTRDSREKERETEDVRKNLLQHILLLFSYLQSVYY